MCSSDLTNARNMLTFDGCHEGSKKNGHGVLTPWPFEGGNYELNVLLGRRLLAPARRRDALGARAILAGVVESDGIRLHAHHATSLILGRATGALCS